MPGAGLAGCQAVERALAVLELFGEETEDVSAAEVARALQVHRSTAWRLLGALAQHGLLQQDALTGRFRLGLALVTLGGLVLGRFPVRTAARPALRELRDATGESAYLGVLDGDEVVYLDFVPAPQVAAHVDWVGYRQPAGETATGRVLLVPPERGYGVRFDEAESGTASAAAPVRDHRGATVAAVSAAGPRFRIDRERLEGELVPTVVRAAARISEALGHSAAA